MNASVTRKSGETSSTHIIDDEWVNARCIVLVKTSTTSIASITLRIAMTSESIASSQRGNGCASATGPSAGRAVDGVAKTAVCADADLLRRCGVLSPRWCRR